ncbi:MAG TPA: DUF4365 domain-containing protein [Solirubrobacterales bacterium]|nr:DUF4365 domain-containing protein [Solirubrobacterales bacterium]
MPGRPRQHELEEASRRAFSALLPDRLVFRDIDREYGIDGEVEEFDDKKATGLRFLIQLKATDEVDLSKALKARVKLSTAAYFRAQPVPVLMVRYLAASDSLYARWFHQFDSYYEHEGERELTFRWEDRHQLSEKGATHLLNEAAAVMEAKSIKLDLPVRAALTSPSEGAFDFSPAELELGVRAAASRCSDLLEIVKPEEEHLLSLEINEGQLAAHVPGLGGLTMHMDELPEEDIAALGSELLSCLVVALARAGHADLASRMAVHFFGDSLLAYMPPFYFEIAEAMAYSARTSEALELAELLDQRDEEDAEAASFAFLLAALRRGAHLRKEEQKRLVVTMEARIQRRVELGNVSDAASESVGLGNYFKTIKNFPKAVHAYEHALELDSAYESREHLWLELAGVYFLAGKFPESAEAYGRALSLAETPALDVQARQADALMHAGEYQKAYDIFEPITADETDLGAWATTKAAALWWVIRTTGVASQDRASAEATQIAAQFADRELSPTEVARVSEEIWQADAVSPLGWFNLARDYLNNGQRENAMFAYLVTAVMQEGDVEAWVNVAHLGMFLDEASLAAAAIVTGARLNGEKYMVEFARVARASLPDPQAREEALSAVNAMLEEALPEKAEAGFEVRLVSEGKPIESVRLPPPGRQ